MSAAEIRRRAAAAILALTLGACDGVGEGIGGPAMTGHGAEANTGPGCAAVGGWADGQGAPRTHDQVIAKAAGSAIVLLGERHYDPTHQLWQMSVAAGVLGRKPRTVLAFEMLPRARPTKTPS